MIRRPSTGRFLVALVAAAIAAPAFFTLSLRVLLNPNGIFAHDFWSKTLGFSMLTVGFGGLGAFIILGVCYRVVLGQKTLHEADIFFASFIAALVHSVIGFILAGLNAGAGMLLGFFFEFAALTDHRVSNYALVFASKVIGGLAASILFLSILQKAPLEE